MSSDVEGLALAAEFRSVSGVLSSHVDSRDIKISSAAITFHGIELLRESFLELSYGNRYGLVGPNGCGMYFFHSLSIIKHTIMCVICIYVIPLGKSTLLTAIGNREFPIPPSSDIFHLRREMDAIEKTALEAVMDVDEERIRLEKEVDILTEKNTEGFYMCLTKLYNFFVLYINCFLNTF